VRGESETKGVPAETADESGWVQPPNDAVLQTSAGHRVGRVTNAFEPLGGLG
jgi:hypothetical protein